MRTGFTHSSFLGFGQSQPLWEYRLVAHPDKAVQEKIVREKEHFYDVYRQEVDIRVQPHIAIAGFWAKEMMEETLARWIQRICHLQRGFPVTLNNYSGFPPDTIYMRVQDPQPFRHLAVQLKMMDSFIQSYDCPPVEVSLLPYLPLTGRLPEAVYENALRAYAQRSFHECFQVDTLALLRRRFDTDAFERVNTFTLPPHLNLFE